SLATCGSASSLSPGGAPTAGAAVVAPGHGVYLGAFANPQGANGRANGGMATYDQLVTLEGQIHRTLAIDLHYSAWNTALASESVVRDLSAGRIPLISWECGDTDANVAAGQDDQLLVSQARSIAGLGKPVMIRWFWEMEFTGSNGGRQGTRNATCIGSDGASGFIAAWRHIVAVFRANGATRASWVFCPGGEAYGPNAQARGVAASTYYPGDAYVDWIAEDVYSRAAPVPFAKLVAGMYSEYGNSGKPLIVCETGAEGSYQPTFISGMESDVPAGFPNLKGVVYFDSHGPLGSYVLTPDGLPAFASLGKDPYFAVMPSTP
ncbi:MAG: glycoside hydrolase family 26 protein, partial [Candidatus Dormibacteria bacterium]